jgi:hypothetical protein
MKLGARAKVGVMAMRRDPVARWREDVQYGGAAARAQPVRRAATG